MAAKRLTEALRDFAARCLAKGPEVAPAVVAFLEGMIKSGLALQASKPLAPVVGLGSLAKLSALPCIEGTLAMHAEALLERIGNEIEARGALWQAQGLHGALEEHLLKPLRPEVATVEDRVAALETLATPPAPSRFRGEASSPTGPFGTPPVRPDADPIG